MRVQRSGFKVYLVDIVVNIPLPCLYIFAICIFVNKHKHMFKTTTGVLGNLYFIKSGQCPTVYMLQSKVSIHMQKNHVNIY